MDKTLRCTVCTWRGGWSEAAGSPPVRPAQLDAVTEQIQAAYEEKEIEAAQVGGHRPPRCPSCGHHTLEVKLHLKSPAM